MPHPGEDEVVAMSTPTGKGGDTRSSPTPSDSDSGYSSRHLSDVDHDMNPEGRKGSLLSGSNTGLFVGNTSALSPSVLLATNRSFQQQTNIPQQQSFDTTNYTFTASPQLTAGRVTQPSSPDTPQLAPFGLGLPQAAQQFPFPAPWTPIPADSGLLEANSVLSRGKAKLDDMHSFSSRGLQVRVLGVPQQNAKSRVETQVKICLQLVTDKGDKVPLWSHLSLPEYLVPKEKLRRFRNGERSLSANADGGRSILHLEASVVCASDVTKSVGPCMGCIQRERKRARKKEITSSKKLVKQETGQPADVATNAEESLDEESLSLEQRKIVLFNCAEMVDFSSGDTILPTRITCYCRHHGEKLGFCIYFIVKDHTGQIMATGISPPIMITDDHKSTKAKPHVSRKRQRVDAPLSPPTESYKPSANLDPLSQVSQSFASYGIPAEISQPQGSIQQQLPQATQGVSAFAGQDMHLAPVFPGSESVSIAPHSPISMHSPEAHPSSSQILQSPTPELTLGSMGDNQLFSPIHGQTAFNCLPTEQNGLTAHMDPDFMMELEHPMFGLAEGADFAALDDFVAQNRGHELDLTVLPQTLPSSGSIVNPPAINKLIPAEGPVHGGLEITILGSGFYDGMTVMFGAIPATRTQFWSETTLVCTLPPAPAPGVVPVLLRESQQLMNSEDNSDVVFTYKDDSDRALMELALQVLGLRMTGKLEDARQIAMRIVSDPTGNAGASGTAAGNGGLQLAGSALAMAALKSSLNLPVDLRGADLERLILQNLCESELCATSGTRTSTQHSILLQECRRVRTPKTQHTLLHLAVFARMSSLAKWLVANKLVDVDAVDASGFSALHLAAWMGLWSVARALLEAGARQTLQTAQGLLPLHLAVYGGHHQVARLLSMPNLPVVESTDQDASSDDDISTIAPICPSIPRRRIQAALPSDCASKIPVQPQHIEPVAATLDTPTLDDDDLADTPDLKPYIAEHTPLSRRFVDRPRRGKRGRGGRGGAGTQHRGASGAGSINEKHLDLDVDIGFDSSDNELIKSIEEHGGKQGMLYGAKQMVEDVVEAAANGGVTVDEKKLLSVDREKTMHLDTGKTGNKPLQGGGWYNPWVALPTLFAFPVSFPAPTFGFSAKVGTGAVDKSKGHSAADSVNATEQEVVPDHDDSALPPYSPAEPVISAVAPSPHGQTHIAHPHQTRQQQQQPLYPTPPLPSPSTRTYPTTVDDVDWIYLDEDLAAIPCDCVMSYAGTHDTHHDDSTQPARRLAHHLNLGRGGGCRRYQAMRERKKEIAAVLGAGSGEERGRKVWRFWVGVGLALLITLLLLRLLLTRRDVEHFMHSIEQLHTDMLGRPLKERFEDVRRWGADQGEEARAWLQTLKAGRLVV